MQYKHAKNILKHAKIACFEKPKYAKIAFLRKTKHAKRTVYSIGNFQMLSVGFLESVGGAGCRK